MVQLKLLNLYNMVNKATLFSLCILVIWIAGCGLEESSSTNGNLLFSQATGKSSTEEPVVNSIDKSGVVASLELSPPEILMKPESKVRFSVVAKDKYGNIVDFDDNNLNWESSDPLICPINAKGIITGEAEGISEIHAKFGEIVSQPVKIVINNVVPKPYPIDAVSPREDSLQESSYSSGLRVHFLKDFSGNYNVEWSSIRFFLNGMEITSPTTSPSCQGQPCGWAYYESDNFFAAGDNTAEIRFYTLSGELKDYVWRFRTYWNYYEDRPIEIRVWPPEDSRPFTLDAVTVFFDLYLNACSQKMSGSWEPDDWYVSHQLYVDGESVESSVYADGCAIINNDDTAEISSITTGTEVVRGLIVYTPNPPLISGRHNVTMEIHTYQGRLIQYQWDFEAP